MLWIYTNNDSQNELTICIINCTTARIHKVIDMMKCLVCVNATSARLLYCRNHVILFIGNSNKQLKTPVEIRSTSNFD